MPNPRISGTGLTRIAASSTPRMNDPIADQKVSWIVIQNAPRTLYLGSDRKLKSTRLHLSLSEPAGPLRRRQSIDLCVRLHC